VCWYRLPPELQTTVSNTYRLTARRERSLMMINNSHRTVRMDL